MSKKTLRCAVCKNVISVGEEFAVIQVAGFFVNGFLSGQNGGDVNDNDVVKFYLCSSACRSKHIGTFWRRVFPTE